MMCVRDVRRHLRPPLLSHKPLHPHCPLDTLHLPCTHPSCLPPPQSPAAACSLKSHAMPGDWPDPRLNSGAHFAFIFSGACMHGAGALTKSLVSLPPHAGSCQTGHLGMLEMQNSKTHAAHTAHAANAVHEAHAPSTEMGPGWAQRT